ncbi:MAG: hypothetical protein KGL48_12140 [Sphingomonadales bacterium]|nr:hypothetical protein [Sphingomonadales bacterium]MDE2568251.1 hypothetical protein [Sphingomonadales bacterium]
MALAMALLAAAGPVAASAQDTGGRLDAIEAQLRALQRKVFPNGAGKTFAPEITPGAVPAPTAQGAPSTSAVTDLLARMDAVEAQLARLTSQVEVNSNRLSKLEAKVGAMQPAPAAGDGATPGEAVNGAAIGSNTAAMTGGASQHAAAPAPAAPTAVKSAAKPSADRIAAVKAVVMPDTGDKGEDEYLYGYRLWDAKLYPEAEQQLQKVVGQYPKHKRISYVRNLLGRAYLDDDKPGTAAQWFVQNYQADKAGDRAPDSLLYLAVAMRDLKETKRACLALEEFQRTYPGEKIGRLKTQYDRISSSVKCN